VFFAISLLRQSARRLLCVAFGIQRLVVCVVSLVIRSALFSWNVATFRFSTRHLDHARAVNLWVCGRSSTSIL